MHALCSVSEQAILLIKDEKQIKSSQAMIFIVTLALSACWLSSSMSKAKGDLMVVLLDKEQAVHLVLKFNAGSIHMIPDL